MRRRLYLQIYLGVVGVALAFTLVVGFAMRHLYWTGEDAPRFLERTAEQIAGEVSGAEPGMALAGTLQREASRLGVHAAVFDAEGALLASTRGPRDRHRGPRGRDGAGRSAGRESGPGESERRGSLHGRGGRFPRIPGITVELADGRWLRVSPRRGRERPGSPALAGLLLLAAIGAGAYPVSRRITRRLERLQRGVEHLGEGHLASRVEVEGNDEVAELARSFNRAADRIETLVESQRRLLASASHELRTPLARLRVAIELLAESPREDLRAEAERDIAELDELIGDLLLAARLEAGGGARVREVELLPLLREEAARFDVALAAPAPTPGGVDDAFTLRGDPAALRRLLRNLLDNAQRYGAPPVAVRLATGSDGARIEVTDAGPGVPESEREAIFEPFHRPSDHSEGRHGGVGLGLALVREIARRHGGEARCRASGHGGTVFEVELRGVPEEAEAATDDPPGTPA